VKIIGIIPARGGSKSIKKKNIVKIYNKPLIYWTIKSAKESKLLDDFYLSTEDPVIKKIASKYGCKVIDRPKKLAKDNSSTISVLQHCISVTKADAIMCLQPTSPIRPKGIIDKAIKKFLKFKPDSLATGRTLHNYEWGKYNNLGRQNLSGWFWDDGSIYLMKSKDLIKGNWTGKKLFKLYVDKKYSLVECDDKTDLKILDKLIRLKYYNGKKN
tara:strand:- start:169 stop:810 length:642 start_codon:yes stop_codon:yes gene_type:complete